MAYHLTTGKETLGTGVVLSLDASGATNMGLLPQFATDTACEGPSCAQASTPCPEHVQAAKVGNVGNSR